MQNSFLFLFKHCIMKFQVMLFFFKVKSWHSVLSISHFERLHHFCYGILIVGNLRISESIGLTWCWVPSIWYWNMTKVILSYWGISPFENIYTFIKWIWGEDTRLIVLFIEIFCVLRNHLHDINLRKCFSSSHKAQLTSGLCFKSSLIPFPHWNPLFFPLHYRRTLRLVW